MSVMKYGADTISKVTSNLISNSNLLDLICDNSKEYKNYYEKRPFLKIGEADKKQQFVGRMMWYAFVANQVAFSLQYKEEINPFSTDFDILMEDCSWNSSEEALIDNCRTIVSLYYNIFTNDGNHFLSAEWLAPFQRLHGSCQEILEEFEKNEVPYY